MNLRKNLIILIIALLSCAAPGFSQPAVPPMTHNAAVEQELDSSSAAVEHKLDSSNAAAEQKLDSTGADAEAEAESRLDATSTETGADAQRRLKLIELARREAGLLQRETETLRRKLRADDPGRPLPEFTSADLLRQAERAAQPAEQLKFFEDAVRALKGELRALNDIWSEASVELTVREISRKVAGLRELELKHPVEFQYLDATKLREYLDQALERQFPDNTFGEYEFAIKQLGLVPAEVDLRELLVALYAEQIGGLFDDESRKLFVMKQFDLNTEVAKIILAHEICHALQDQHYRLAEWPIHETQNDDLALAAAAILEGDATVLMMEWAANEATWKVLFDVPDLLTMNQQALKSAPPAVVEMLIFPYIAGMEFLQVRKLTASREEYERIFRSPPRSTEQILHPEKYFNRRDEPNHFQLRDYSPQLGAGWRLAYRNVLGELGVSLCLLGKIGELERREAAAGWDGDGYYLYRGLQAADYLLVWAAIVDSEEDAIELADALDQIHTPRRGELRRVERAGEFRVTWETPFTVLQQEGPRVLLAETSRRETLEKIFAVIFEDLMNVPEVH